MATYFCMSLRKIFYVLSNSHVLICSTLSKKEPEESSWQNCYKDNSVDKRVIGCLHGLFIDFYIAYESVISNHKSYSSISHLMPSQLHNTMLFSNQRQLCIMYVLFFFFFFYNHRQKCLDCSAACIGWDCV